MAVTIRKLKKPDLGNGFLESLSALFRIGLTPKKAEAIFKRIKKNPFYRIFVAEMNGKIVGVVTLLIEQKFLLKGARFSYLEDMAVHKDFQGKGIGKMLVQAAIEEANKEKCLNVRLDCNDETAPFYEKSGFQIKHHVNRMQINLRSVKM